MSDPREWTARQRDAVLASLLSDFLETVPTERTAWTADAAELARRTDEARSLSRQMDALSGKGGDRDLDR
ncbi:hypothetical protein [Actinocorallia longicatena]|uniref:Addiction module component n=1 Tax=Actinocorallia longicatena TaxID=111803 RepID=A0ABP6QIC0_9ACTN